ncbi:hypothetical protein LSTR_LSTR000469 [Laodelphax striatellus]|uniref:Uncharacterized protein n=1 Tax=Laodelphax striatellus TaxID=195883 RepID=A0A482X3I9_LAOST|nr:hypothetical protein LSTR_LSTR000469 [Laodelphax striatellus]
MQPTKPPDSSEKSSIVIANMDCDEEELSPAQVTYYSRAENDYQTLWTSLQKKLKMKGLSDIPEPLHLTQFPKNLQLQQGRCNLQLQQGRRKYRNLQ